MIKENELLMAAERIEPFAKANVTNSNKPSFFENLEIKPYQKNNWSAEDKDYWDFLILYFYLHISSIKIK